MPIFLAFADQEDCRDVNCTCDDKGPVQVATIRQTSTDDALVARRINQAIVLNFSQYKREDKADERAKTSVHTES